MTAQIRRLDGYLKGKGPGTDKRDYNIRQLPLKLAKLPDTYLTVANPIILDQGSTMACVAFCSSGIKTDEEYREWQKVYKFDAPWLYSLIAQPEGGAYPRDACDIMLKQGFKLSGCRQKPDLKWGIEGYYGITTSNTDAEIQATLFQYGSIILASNWYDNWMNSFLKFPAPGNINGGHCYRCVGWVQGFWVIANSWGKLLWGQYGGGGMALMSTDILRSTVLPQGDCWKVVDKV